MSIATVTLQDLATGTWTTDPSHTALGFTARHLMVTKVRGEFKDFDATIEVKEPVHDSTVSATVQMGSVSTGTADRDTHLRSADFFDVENYPTMTFVSTGFTGDTLTGDLTIKDVTKSVTFDVDFGGVVSDPWGNTKAGFEATTEINRKDWGLTWNAAIEGGGVLVSEKVMLNLDVQLVQTAS